MRVWFLGMGRMGWPMCRSLADHGIDVIGVDPDPTAVQRARAAGLAAYLDPSGAGRAPDVVISMLPTAATTLAEAASLAPMLTAGSCWVDMGSHTPETGQALRVIASGHRIDVLEAPVGGGPDAAARAELQVLAAGDAAVFDRVLPLLAVMADPARVIYLGAAGHGYLSKLLINQVWFVQACAFTEALLTAAAAGIDLSQLAKALAESAVAGRFVDRDLPALLRGDYLRSFGLAGCVEELHALQQIAASSGIPTPVSSATTEIHLDALKRFGPVDGELLGAAELEHRAGFTLHQAGDPPAERG